MQFNCLSSHYGLYIDIKCNLPFFVAKPPSTTSTTHWNPFQLQFSSTASLNPPTHTHTSSLHGTCAHPFASRDGVLWKRTGKWSGSDPHYLVEPAAKSCVSTDVTSTHTQKTCAMNLVSSGWKHTSQTTRQSLSMTARVAVWVRWECVRYSFIRPSTLCVMLCWKSVDRSILRWS